MDDSMSKQIEEMEELVRSASKDLELSAQSERRREREVFTTPVLSSKLSGVSPGGSGMRSHGRDLMSRFISEQLIEAPLGLKAKTQETLGAEADPLIEKFRRLGESFGLTGRELSRYVSDEVKQERQERLRQEEMVLREKELERQERLRREELERQERIRREER